MKPKHFLPATLVASALALSSCDEAPGTRDMIESTHNQTERILAHRTMSEEPEGIALLERLDRSKKLYTMLDEGEYTTQYFNTFAREYETQGKNHELAGRLADVRARLATLADLIQDQRITDRDVETILRNNLLISGAHESQSPLITVSIEGNVREFFQEGSPMTVTLKESDLLLKKENGDTLTVSIQHS